MDGLLTNQDHVTSEYLGRSASAGHTLTVPPLHIYALILTHIAWLFPATHTQTHPFILIVITSLLSSIHHAQQRTDQVRKHLSFYSRIFFSKNYGFIMELWMYLTIFSTLCTKCPHWYLHVGIVGENETMSVITTGKWE